MKNIKYLLLSTILVGFTSCNDIEDVDRIEEEAEVVLPALTAGSADFSNFVAVGASFTAGFTDNGLFIAAQENSFPNTIAKQFAKVGGGTFTQPLMADNFGGLTFGGNRILDPRLVFGGAGPVPLESVIGPVSVGTELLAPPTGPFKNLGVPGAKSFHLVAPGYGNIGNVQAGLANPYATRLVGGTASADANDTVIDLAVDQNPSFFTLSEVGGNDVLGYATSGGDGSNPITPTATFNGSLNLMVAQLTANGSKGAIGNLPDIKSLSFFTTVDYNPVPLDAGTAAQLNAGYATYNGGLQFAVANNLLTQAEADRRTIVFAAATDNAVVIEDETLTNLAAFGIPSLRQAEPTDLILLTAGAQIPNGLGTQTPMNDTFVLLPSEQAEIDTATASYNATIASVASANGLALVDLNSILNEASTTGIQFDDFNLDTSLVFGGLVSLDGVHLTARGYALMANAFLDAIDAQYGSNFRASGNVAKAADFVVGYSPAL